MATEIPPGRCASKFIPTLQSRRVLLHVLCICACHRLTLPDSLPSCLQTIEHALEAGGTVLIENLEESMDPVLGPLLGREVIKKGR